MKRSEMIKLMFDVMTNSDYYNDDGGVELVVRLDQMLMDMEKAGMLPPPYATSIMTGKISKYGEIETYEWEPEDE